MKNLKIQKQIFASTDKELTKAEYERLLQAAKQKKNERLYLLMQTIYGFLDSEVVGSDFIIVDGVLTKYIGESSKLIIPDGVIEIHYNPFASVHDFDLISIPKTLVKIPGEVFRECTAKNINVDKDNPKYYTM